MYEAGKCLLWCPNVDKPSIGAVRLDANRGGRGGVALQTCRNPVSN